jgi:hypothetical protein
MWESGRVAELWISCDKLLLEIGCFWCRATRCSDAASGAAVLLPMLLLLLLLAVVAAVDAAGSRGTVGAAGAAADARTVLLLSEDCFSCTVAREDTPVPFLSV